MATIGKLAAVVTANTAGFDSGMVAVESIAIRTAGTLTRTYGAVRKVALAAVALFAILGAASVFSGGARDVESFNQAMANSTAIMRDLTAEQKSAMAHVARSVAYDTSFNATEIAQGYYYLASAGMDLRQSLMAIGPAARFAQAGNFDLATATDLATDAQSALGLSVKNAEQNVKNLTRVTDVLIGANTLANASAQQFSEAMTNKSGAAARQLGMDIEELAAILAAFADQGVKGAEAGTQVGIVLRDLQTKAIQNKAAFQKMRVAVFDSRGEFRKVADILHDLEAALDGMSDETRKATLLNMGFADKSVGALLTLIGLSEKVRDYEASLREMSGMTDAVAGDQLPAMTEATGKLHDAMSRLFDLAFRPWLDGLAAGLGAVAEWMHDIENLTNSATIRIIAWVAAFSAAMLIIPRIIALATALVKALKAIATSQAIVTAMTGPKGWASLAASVAVASGAVLMLNAKFADMEAQARKAEQAATDALKPTGEADAATAAIDAASRAAELAEAIAAPVETTADRLKELERRAESIIEATMTPIERYGQAVAELEELLDARLISEKVFARGLAAARKDLADANGGEEKRGASGAVRGTAAAIRAEREALDEQRRMKQIMRELLDEQRRQGDDLHRLANRPPVEFDRKRL